MLPVIKVNHLVEVALAVLNPCAPLGFAGVFNPQGGFNLVMRVARGQLARSPPATLDANTTRRNRDRTAAVLNPIQNIWPLLLLSALFWRHRFALLRLWLNPCRRLSLRFLNPFEFFLRIFAESAEVIDLFHTQICGVFQSFFNIMKNCFSLFDGSINGIGIIKVERRISVGGLGFLKCVQFRISRLGKIIHWVSNRIGCRFSNWLDRARVTNRSGFHG